METQPPPPPTQKEGQSPPQFSAHVCCGQTAGWIKLPLGTEVGLGTDHIVLDGDPAPHGKGHSMSIVAKQSPISATADLFFLFSLRAVDIELTFVRISAHVKDSPIVSIVS